MVIDVNAIIVENASKAVKCGRLMPEAFSPVSKNPIIARFFNQMGRADELGSGMRNLYRYVRLYSGQAPDLREGDTFVTTIPLDETFSIDQDDGHAGIVPVKNGTVPVKTGIVPVNRNTLNRTERINKLCQLVRDNPGFNRKQLASYLGITEKTVGRYLQELRMKIEYRGSDKNGGYYYINAD